MTTHNLKLKNGHDLYWVTWMARWGKPSPNHAYPASIHDSPEEAEKAGKEETQCRGGKYQYQFSPSYVNLGIDQSRKETKSDKNLDQELIVCWVVYEDTSFIENDIVHFVGLFDSELIANNITKLLYPNFSVKTERMKIIRGASA